LTPQLRQVVRRPEKRRVSGEVFSGIRRVLVVRQDRLGDFILTIPAIAALGETYRDARLGVLVSPGVVPFAELVTGVDEVIPTSSTPSVLSQRLAEFDPDLIVCISRGAAVPRAAWRRRVANRVGNGSSFYSPLFSRRVNVGTRRSGCHEVEFALSFAHRCGAAAGPARSPIALPMTAHDAAAAWLERNGVTGPFVVLHPGSGGSCPSWPVDHFSRLAGALAAEGIHVVISLGPLDEALRAPMALACDSSDRVVSVTQPLPTFAAMVSRAALVVSNSTGPIHMAAALGSATLAIHAPWASCSAERWGPYAENGWAIVVNSDTAMRWSHRKRRRLSAELLGAIDPGLVQRCVQTILARGSEPLDASAFPGLEQRVLNPERREDAPHDEIG
jgi:ADP-heptose:LPS heptosyltransferase